MIRSVSQKDRASIYRKRESFSTRVEIASAARAFSPLDSMLAAHPVAGT
jgi:hypothetical protein